MTPERQAVLEAIKDMVKERDPRLKVEALDAVSTLARRYPVALTGSLSVLNPLVQIRVTDDEEWEVIKTRIDVRREKEGLDPCWPPPAPEKFSDRYNEYQRNLMQEIRARCRRATVIENMQRSEATQLRGNARLEFERKTQLAWGKRRDAVLEKAREAAGGTWNREARRAVTDEFWAAIDKELDNMEARARTEQVQPAHRRKAK